MLNGIISKINGSTGNLTFKQTGGQTTVAESHEPSALHPVVHEGSRVVGAAVLVVVIVRICSLQYSVDTSRRVSGLLPLYLPCVSSQGCATCPHR